MNIQYGNRVRRLGGAAEAFGGPGIWDRIEEEEEGDEDGEEEHWFDVSPSVNARPSP